MTEKQSVQSSEFTFEPQQVASPLGKPYKPLPGSSGQYKRQTPNTMETSPWDYARRGGVRGQPSEGPMTVPLLAGFSSVSTSIASPASSSREINEELLSIEQSNSSTPVPVKGLGDQVIDSIDSIDVSRCVDTPTSCSRSNSSTQL